MGKLDVRLEKKLSYRLNIPPGQEDQVLLSVAEHWDGFTWEAGREIVAWVSDTHGTIQVWAITQAEGQGVIEHALAHMQVSPDDGEWVFTTSKNPRFGKVGTVRATIAAVRSGSDGPSPHTYLLGQFSADAPA